MKKIITLLTIAILFAFSCTTRLPRNKINVVDNLNRKQGLWITSDTSSKINVLSYKNGDTNGKYYSYHSNGQIAIYGRYLHGNKQGKWYYYHINGQVVAYGKYFKDKKQGIWRRYSSSGLLGSIITYKQDSIVNRVVITYNAPW